MRMPLEGVAPWRIGAAGHPEAYDAYLKGRYYWTVVQNPARLFAAP